MDGRTGSRRPGVGVVLLIALLIAVGTALLSAVTYVARFLGFPGEITLPVSLAVRGLGMLSIFGAARLIIQCRSAQADSPTDGAP